MERIRPAAWTPVALPYGLWRGDAAFRSASVRSLDGRDEMALEDAQVRGATPLALGNMLIERCARIDGAPFAVGALALGDREILLRALHAETVAPRFEAMVACGCGGVIVFDLDLRALAAPAPEPGPTHRLRIGGRVLTVRVPSTSDLAAALGSEAPDRALAYACAGLDTANDALSEALARLDPNAECALRLDCPDCGAASTAYLDAFPLLRHALAETGSIFAQVDRIARAYGWSETDILDLPRPRRLRYLALAA